MTQPVVSGPLRVLHAEDNDDDAQLIEQALLKDGLQVQMHRVETLDDLRAAFEAPRFDVILSDFRLAGFDGFAVLDRARKQFPDVPFILVTGTIGEERATDALKRGATDFVLKHRLERVGPAVRRALAEVRERGQRREAEEALRRSEQEFRSAFDGAPIGMAICDGAFTFVRGNPALARMLSIDAEALPALSIPSLLHEEDAAVIRDHLERTFRTGVMLSHPEVRMRAGDGRNVWVRMTCTGLRDHAGRRTHLLTMLEDITEQKESEIARMALEVQLQRAQKLEAVGRLTGGVAHDFNNLLTAVLGSAELLLLELGQDDPRRADVEVIRDAGRRGAALTKQLLAFSRKQVLQPQVLDLNALVANMDTLLRRMTREDVTLQLSLTPHIPLVRADPGQLEQVIANLVVNARDAMPSGGSIVVETSSERFDAERASQHALASAGEYVRLSVRDNGTGMDEAVQALIFDPFFTTKGEGKGTGLGLATTYGIVKQSGGFIVVNSTLGKGSTFEVYLPAADDTAGGARRQAAS